MKLIERDGGVGSSEVEYFAITPTCRIFLPESNATMLIICVLTVLGISSCEWSPQTTI